MKLFTGEFTVTLGTYKESLSIVKEDPIFPPGTPIFLLIVGTVSTFHSRTKIKKPNPKIARNTTNKKPIPIAI